MRTWSLLLLLLAAVSVASAEAAKCVSKNNDTMHLQRLRKDLLCQYDREAGPTVLPNGQTKLQLRFLRARMDVDEADNSLTVLGYVMLLWKDEWLGWDAARYAGVKRVYVDSQEIWTPSIVMVEAPTKVLTTGQALVMDGTVIWTILAPLRAPCRSDPARWPYDTMVCNVTLGNLAPERARLVNGSIQLNLIKWKSRGWELRSLAMRSFKAAGFEDGLRIEILARRSAAMLEATAVLPVVAVSALLLAAPWLPADGPHRPLLLCAVVLLQVLLAAVLPARVRVAGAHAPSALLLLRDALALSAGALLQWLLARWLLAEPGPRLAACLVDWMAGPRLAAILALPALPAGRADDRARRALAALTDRATFVALAAALAGLCARLLP